MQTSALTKGIQGTFRRGTLLPVRYGLTPDRIRLGLLRMQSVLERWELTPTIPTTGIVLQRHPEIAGALKGVDLAIHGYRHVSYSNLSPQDQALDLDAAREVFSDCGLPVHGFRAPYLQANCTTMELLAQRRFVFDSSSPRMGLQASHHLYERVVALSETRYGLSTPTGRDTRNQAGLVELPVTLPDDEILIDGLGIRNPATLWKVFEALLHHANASSALLVLQVHPERFRLCSGAIELLLEHAIDQAAWLASLSEAADWIRRQGGNLQRWPKGCNFAVSVTGDLDAVSLGDFAHRFLGA